MEKNQTINPNIGGLELAKALTRVLPFTAKEGKIPVLGCVLFKAKEGKLTMVSTDGFRVAEVTLDYDGDEGRVLISRDDLEGSIASALRKAKRVNLSFEKSGDSPYITSLVIDTELICYKWRGVNGNFPDYKAVIPKEFTSVAHLDSVQASKTLASLKVLAGSEDCSIDLTIGNGKVIMSCPDDKGQAVTSADTQGEGRVRINGVYLSQALKACGGMVDLKLAREYQPVLFAAPNYTFLVLPKYPYGVANKENYRG